MDKPTEPYLLIFRDSAPDRYQSLSAEQRQQLMNQWNAWIDGLTADGKMSLGRPLELTGRVVSGASGRVVDGPFAESKEAIGGFFLLNVSGINEATEIAQQCPSLALGLIVEVRPVADCCPIFRADKLAAAHELSVNLVNV